MISVITRTKNRTIFLNRIFDSLQKQSYRPIEWIIVNDAGEDITSYIETFKKQSSDDFDIKYIYKEQSTTMEAATNFALAHATGKYINILDDDDTIDVDFYKSAVHYLEKESLPSIKGVIAYSQYIYEKVLENGEIEYIKKEDFPNKPVNLTISAMLQYNQFPIHAFVYYKDTLDDTGLYDETLPVLGDWEFNIRFIEKFDIGVIPKIYVNYHRRVDENYGNTITTQKDQHLKYEAFLRNKILRNYANNPNIAIDMGQSFNAKMLIDKFSSFEKILAAINKHKSEQIAQRDMVIEQKNEQIAKRDMVIEQKNEQIAKRDMVIEQKNEQIAKRDTVIEQKNEQIVQRDTLIEQQNEQIDQKNKMIDQKNQMIEKLLLEQKEHTLLQEEKKSFEIREKSLRQQLYQRELEAIRYRDLAESLRLKNRVKRALQLDEEGAAYKVVKSLQEDGLKQTLVKVQQKLDALNASKQNPAAVEPEAEENSSDMTMESIKESVANNYLQIPQEQPLVSIVVLTRDGLTHLKRLFKALKENTVYKNYELIVVDNNSEDESVAFLEENPYDLPLKVIKNSYNASFSAGNNQAVAISKGEYILLLNNDIAPLKGWLSHLVSVMQENDNVGSVGSQLLYPSDPNEPLSLKVQHSGIAFRYDYIEQLKLSFFRPYNLGVGKRPIVVNKSMQTSEKIALTAACLLLKREVYDAVGGLDEGYDYGYEDVDLGLKLYKAGYKNYYCQNSILFHYESSTQKLQSQKEIKGRRLHNIQYIHKKWNSYIKEHYFFEKFKTNQRLFTQKSLKIAFAVTEAGENAVAGDYFTALELAEAFGEMGYEYSFLVRRGGDWLTIPKDVDIVVSMLDAYDLNLIKNRDKKVLTVAWVRNWPDKWLQNPSFMQYDLVFASSQKLCDMLSSKSSRDVFLLPIATNPKKFEPSHYRDEAFKSDYVFTGNHWGKPREIEQFLDPAKLDFQFAVYGKDWHLVDKFKPYHRGFLQYQDMPKVYANTKIVIDDAVVGITKPYGSVNSRVFDALGAGVLVISNGVIGAKELFGDLLPTYESHEELHKHLDYYLKNEDAREALVKKLQQIIVQKHTYRIRAHFMKQKLEELLGLPKSVAVKMPIPKWEEAKNWGDFHLAEGLKKEFEEEGYHVVMQILPEWDNAIGMRCDSVLVLRGLSVYEPKEHQINMMWNISHPDKITPDEYNSYDKVYISSQLWAQKMQSYLDVPVEVMHQCCDPERFKPCKDESYHHQLLFVGNSRNIFRKALQYIIPTKYELAVYGTLWEKFIDKKYIKGEYIDNRELFKYYSNADIVLNDHWDSMRENGFISNRMFDVLACNGFIITDDVVGIKELFGELVPTYKNKEELRELVDYYMQNPSLREEISKKGRDLVLQTHTYKNRVLQMLAFLKEREGLVS